MPITTSPATPGAKSTSDGADFFLHVQTKRAGKIKGEASVPGHMDDIVVSGWAWGVQAGLNVGDSRQTARRSYSALTVTKQIDRATTGLMAALATNDEVKEAKLTMRRAGGQQEDYFSVTLRKARVASLTHSAAADGSTLETLTLSFTEVEVEYKPQQATGLRAGALIFNDEIHPDA